ncbi:related to hsp70 protein [Phialocephala subalpina]|uniref:Related to hsp70 protein n=1 Tax=Phialocephala subalpina TaxID=576137 RepID=A0A1L7XP78_9HELO|nr:related to hsp70 protein [Phialocephala subalpina]
MFSNINYRGMSLDSTSTATVREMSEYHTRSPGDEEMQVDSEDIPATEPRYIIATDFGTTFSAVAYIRRTDGRPSKSRMITNYNEDPIALNGHPNPQVPTESCYIVEDQDDDSSYAPAPAEEPKDEVMEDIYDDHDSEDDSTPTERGDDDDDMELDEEYPALYWGYEIQAMMNRCSETERRNFKRIARSKLLLDKNERTQQIRDDLEPILRKLKQSKNRGKKMINRNEDVIAHYLVHLFRHTKEQLEKQGISGDSVFEHVLCVPAIWDTDACIEMQNAVSTAVKETGFGSMNEFFLVSEPEAAAAYVLAEQVDELNAGEAFLLLDAGGGTVDATIYRVTERFPLRLSDEIVPAGGCLGGSSFVNDAFREHLRKRLRGEVKHIEKDGYTLDGILDEEVREFEHRTKRVTDIYDYGRRVDQHIRIRGLKPNERKRLSTNTIMLNRADFRDIFSPSLDAIRDLMKNQRGSSLETYFLLIQPIPLETCLQEVILIPRFPAVQSARNIDVEVQKVILVGGFSASKALRTLLQKTLDELSISYGYLISLILPADGDPQTAIVQGAIIRAWDKDKGPKRFLQLSYGFQVTEEYNPETITAHSEVRRPKPDKKDGLTYIHDTIEWLVCKGEKIPYSLVKSIVVYHTFVASAKRLECVEILWVSPTSTESHYRKSHPKNKGHARIAGKIIADMTFLKTEKLIKPIEPEKGSKARKHYKVEFQLNLIIEGRNLKFEAVWPIGEEGQPRAEGQVSIAAAFRPGTK